MRITEEQKPLLTNYFKKLFPQSKSVTFINNSEGEIVGVSIFYGEKHAALQQELPILEKKLASLYPNQEQQPQIKIGTGETFRHLTVRNSDAMARFYQDALAQQQAIQDNNKQWKKGVLAFLGASCQRNSSSSAYGKFFHHPNFEKKLIEKHILPFGLYPTSVGGGGIIPPFFKGGDFGFLIE